VVRLCKPDHETLLLLESYDRVAFGPTGLRTCDLAFMVEMGAIYLGRLDDEIAGSCQIMRVLDEPDFCYVVGFYVRPAWQGSGLGRQLLLEVAGQCRAFGTRGMLLTVSPGNTRALALYKGVGFIEEEYLPHFYGEGEDRYVLRWRFTPSFDNQGGLSGSV
jgi:ribosomal protein S18 acetylase RimI-like enzyme